MVGLLAREMGVRESKVLCYCVRNGPDDWEAWEHYGCIYAFTFIFGVFDLYVSGWGLWEGLDLGD